MCGIFGLLSPDGPRADFEQINNLLAHRGPDDASLYNGDGIILGTRRLSILDLENGRQPLCNEDESVWITYNGEVVNAPELRRELQAAGHIFRTNTDTEVIVHAYEQWGQAAVRRLRGMFAFGLWDAPQRRLLLARDRFGIKPLYYTRAGERFAFASEIRPLLALLPELAYRPDLAALGSLFRLGFIPSPRTAFKRVQKLPAAHTLIIVDNEPAIDRYWSLQFPPTNAHRQVSPDAAADEFGALLRETVDLWRLSDVPVGSLLSGGIDSASLAALLTDLHKNPIHTFTIGFTAASHDESARASRTARALGSVHHEQTFDKKAFDLLPQIVRQLEEPQCSATSIPIYLLYHACHAAGFKVIMSGEGADELLGGYHWFDGDRRMQPLLRLPQPLRALLTRAPLPISAAGRRVLANGTGEASQRYALWQQVASPARLASLIQFEGTEPSTYINNGDAGLHPLDRFILLDSQTRLTDFINFEVDRMSMASSVEARPPFLDHKLWEFCAQLPPKTKLDRSGNKLVLRRAMADRLPHDVVKQPKLGLATPHADWWRQARLPDWAEDCLTPAALSNSGYFSSDEVARLRKTHAGKSANHARLLMGILTTQLWHMHFIQR